MVTPRCSASDARIPRELAADALVKKGPLHRQRMQRYPQRKLHRALRAPPQRTSLARARMKRGRPARSGVWWSSRRGRESRRASGEKEMAKYSLSISPLHRSSSTAACEESRGGRRGKRGVRCAAECKGGREGSGSHSRAEDLARGVLHRRSPIAVSGGEGSKRTSTTCI